MLGETDNQFSLTRAAHSRGGREKSKFLSLYFQGGRSDRSREGAIHIQCPNCLFHDTYADSVRYESVPVPVTPKQRIIHAIIGAFWSFAGLNAFTYLVSVSLGTEFGAGITFVVISLFVAATVACGCYFNIDTVDEKLEIASHWICKRCDHTWTIERHDDL
jgi:hypothetical protein